MALLELLPGRFTLCCTVVNTAVFLQQHNYVTHFFWVADTVSF